MMGDTNNNNNNETMMIKQQQQQYYSFEDEYEYEQQIIDLPPGFRFHPTDEELISHYLSPKLGDVGFNPAAIAEVDLNKVEPWDLPKKAKMGEKEWYFFCVRDRKYPTGMRTNRATVSGYWKATGKDKEIYRGKSSLVGMKKTLVFYTGRAPKGHKSGWVMHEYRSETTELTSGTSSSSSDHRNKSSKNDWVLCRIFNKDWNAKKMQIIPEQLITSTSAADYTTTPSYYSEDNQQTCSFLPPLTDTSPMTTTTTNYRKCEDDVLSGLNPSSNVTCISDEDDEDSRKGAGVGGYMTNAAASIFTGAGADSYQFNQYHAASASAGGELLEPYTTDPFFGQGQDQSILRLLMDNNCGDAMSLSGGGGRTTGGNEQCVEMLSTSYNQHYNINNNNNSISHDYGPPIDINCYLNY